VKSYFKDVLAPDFEKGDDPVVNDILLIVFKKIFLIKTIVLSDDFQRIRRWGTGFEWGF
jgi:hypothetical protein